MTSRMINLRRLKAIAKAMHAYIIFNLERIGAEYNKIDDGQNIFLTKSIAYHFIEHCIPLIENDALDDGIRNIMDRYKDYTLPLVIELASCFYSLKKDMPNAKIKFGFICEDEMPYPCGNVGSQEDLIILHVVYCPKRGLVLQVAMDIEED